MEDFRRYFAYIPFCVKIYKKFWAVLEKMLENFADNLKKLRLHCV